MATVKIDQFGGIAPRQHPTLLADGMATTAHNVRLKRGKLIPLRQPKMASGARILLENGLNDIADAKSIHAWKRTNGDIDFLLFPGVTWMAEGNIADDNKTRVIISGETGQGENNREPVVYLRNETTGAKEIVPIVKRAFLQPTATRISTGELTDNKRYTAFFITWVDIYGYESPCSDASEELEYMDGDDIQVSLNSEDTVPESAVKVRIYKVITGSEEGRIQFIKEGYISEEIRSWMIESVKDENAGEVMPEIEAPIADLQNIIDIPGAFYAGFAPSAPKTVCFSDINLLYSWPIAYRYDVKDNIVALAATSNTVFALTDGWPYVLTGTAPEAMTVAKLAGPAACVSPRGVCVYRNAVYYVSNAGLMTIYNSADAGTVCQNLTDKIFTKEQWQEYNPASCVMGQFDGALFLFFTLANGKHKGLTIDLAENSAVAVTTHDEIAKCACVDNKTDKLYFVREG